MKNQKIYFRIPFTEYFLGRDYSLCLFRKVFTYNYSCNYYMVNGHYGYEKV